MTIDEAQLQTWSHQGSIQQSAATYATIKRVLEDPRAPYASRSFDIFLQGSYANDTNVWAESDVDIVIRLDSVYYSDTSRLSVDEQVRHAAIANATYTYFDFRQEVTQWLSANFGNVLLGNKAVTIPASGNRREADVLPCAEFRRYHSVSAQRFDPGICFWSKGLQVENFPKQHSDNATTKHQGTASRFKPMVRVFKNLRNYMVKSGHLADGIAPSYFIEGLLYNVPDHLFGTDYQSSVIASFNWLAGAEKSQLVCANHLHWLVRENVSTSWPAQNLETFLRVSRAVWNAW